MIVHDVAQGSESWFALRAGIPTASKASLLVTSTGAISKSITDYSYQLAAELFVGEPVDMWQGDANTQRGSDMEHEALICYEQRHGVWLDRVGFVTADSALCGASPDGLLDEGMVQIKCQQAKGHIKTMMYFNKHKKAPPEYIPQCQQEMLVCERKWNDLYFYHDKLPSFVIRQEADFQIQGILVKQLAECIKLRDNALKIIQSSQ